MHGKGNLAQTFALSQNQPTIYDNYPLICKPELTAAWNR